MVFVYPIGVPVTFGAILNSFKHNLADPGVRMQIGFLYDAYHLDVWYFELVRPSLLVTILQTHVSSGFLLPLLFRTDRHVPQADDDVAAQVPSRGPANASGHARGHQLQLRDPAHAAVPAQGRRPVTSVRADRALPHCARRLHALLAHGWTGREDGHHLVR
jgi:hypothetical protein